MTTIIGIFITSKFCSPQVYTHRHNESGIWCERPPSFPEHIQVEVNKMWKVVWIMSMMWLYQTMCDGNVFNWCPLFVCWHRTTYLVFHCQVVFGQRDAGLTSLLPHDDDKFRYLAAALRYAGSLFSLSLDWSSNTLYMVINLWAFIVCC